jgi:murein DD-endopeptidase MepM/ murein hydrolase activator NlpD
LPSVLLRVTTIVVASLVWVPVASAWSWPVKGPVLQPFSYDEAHPYDAGQHRGIDIGAAASEDQIVAPAGGTVSFAGIVPTSGQSLTIETADGYSVTLAHLGSIVVEAGASVSEGDVVGTVGPSGTAEQSVPYVHLGIRLTTDPLGYLDPLGLLPAPEPPPAPLPAPASQPVPQAVSAPRHARGGGLGIEKRAAPPPSVPAPARPEHAAKPLPRPKPKAKPTGDSLRTDAPQIRRPVVDSVPAGLRLAVVAPKLVHAIGAEPLALSVAPGLVAALLALVTAFTRGRRRVPAPARIIPLRRELPMRRAA